MVIVGTYGIFLFLLSSNIGVLCVEVKQVKISLQIYGSDYQDDNNNDSHVVHAVFYRDVKSPSNFTMKQHFII
jgi:hypothetical protein